MMREDVLIGFSRQRLGTGVGAWAALLRLIVIFVMETLCLLLVSSRGRLRVPMCAAAVAMCVQLRAAAVAVRSIFTLITETITLNTAGTLTGAAQT